MAVLGACQWYERGIQEGERAENGGLWDVEDRGGDDGKSIRRKDWHIELFKGMDRPDPATLRAHCPKG